MNLAEQNNRNVTGVRPTGSSPRAPRYAITASARFTWDGPDGKRHEGRGKTRDIGTFGVFIYAHPVPIPGAAIEVIVDMPSLAGGEVGVRLSGRGTVLRVDPADRAATGFAAQVVFQTGWAGAPWETDSANEHH